MDTNLQKEKDQLRLTFNFNREDLHLEYTLIGAVVSLKDCHTVGEPGSPALPQATVRIALPPNTIFSEIKVHAQQTIQLTSDVFPVAPLQIPRPAQPPQKFIYHRPGEEQDFHKQLIPNSQQYHQSHVEPSPVPSYTPPDPVLYTQATRRPVASIFNVLEEGLTTVAVVRLNPVHLMPGASLEFTPQIDLSVFFTPRTDQVRNLPPQDIKSRAQALRQIALTKLTVINPEDVADYSDFFPAINPEADYLVITDNQYWDAKKITPTGPVTGDMVASFKSLALWKRRRGVQARVVTITDIVNGHYGDFRSGSRDLQEVIRRFLKEVYTKWGVAWVVIGGDPSIVPIRLMAGNQDGHIEIQEKKLPPNAKSFWADDHLRLRADAGTWPYFDPNDNYLLVRPDSGVLIPYDPAGTSGSVIPGWYFTTDESYITRSEKPTNFVKVNGPADTIKTNLQFLYVMNLVATDLYYSSLIGPHYNQPGKHDWDLLDNGIYGQHCGSNLDGVNYTPSVSLGRISVKTALEATSFITKIIAYEKGKWPDGTRLKDDWSKRVVLVSDNWGGWIWINPSGSESPVPNSYHHPPGANHSLIFLGSTPDPNWSLLAYLNETDVRLLPYRLDAGAEIRGWYFARSNTDLSPNIVVTPFFELPAPTPWIVVYAAGEELSPSNYILNSTQLDGSVIDQEMLREQIKSDMPAFDNITRLYVDIDSMSPDQIDAAPIERFSEVGLTRLLNAGPHIVSLSGHGSQDGCCGLSRSLADRLVNTHRPFILYACSCLTNWVDDDSMSEHITVNPRGGAVAYIGYTRYSFIAAGDDFQQRFFRGSTSLGSNASLGILNDTRASLFDTFGWHVGGWSIAALHLTGDPEMPLWGTKEEFFNIPDYIPVDWLKLIIGRPQTPPSPISNNWGLTFVHISQGIREVNGVADHSGKIELPLRGFHPGPATLTIARAGHLHVEKEVILQKTKKPFIKRVAVLLLLAVVLAILFAVWVFLIQRK